MAEAQMSTAGVAIGSASLIAQLIQTYIALTQRAPDERSETRTQLIELLRRALALNKFAFVVGRECEELADSFDDLPRKVTGEADILEDAWQSFRNHEYQRLFLIGVKPNVPTEDDAVALPIDLDQILGEDLAADCRRADESVRQLSNGFRLFENAFETALRRVQSGVLKQYPSDYGVIRDSLDQTLTSIEAIPEYLSRILPQIFSAIQEEPSSS